MTFTGTYSPDDNKLRLYASGRLDAETLAKVKTAGFKWAPKQELFVAPAWTPSREDLLVELCGEIDDEDTALVDRAEERADRFQDYSEKRMADAERAREAVSAIADGIPFGQPILVGHHSEKHARRDAARIETGMRKAVKMWETSTYWTARAAGAVRAAKYKELPGVRHRRIKTIEADKRKRERSKVEAASWLAVWTREGLTLEDARSIADRCWLTVETNLEHTHGRTAYDVLKGDAPAWSVDQVQAVAREVYPRIIAHCDRWIAHFENRLAYERAMLAEQIGADASAPDPMGSRFDFKPGGKVDLGRDGWLTILRVNRSGGAVTSLTTAAPAYVTWAKQWKYGVEKVRAYQPPTEAEAATVKKATALPPLCNYPGEGFREMTEAGWKAAMNRKWSDFSYIATANTTPTAGRHRFRQMPHRTKQWGREQVFITDAKRVDPPAPAPTEQSAAAPHVESRAPAPIADVFERVESPTDPCQESSTFLAMRDSLRAGVKVAAAPELFPTPIALAARLVEEAGLRPGHRILEPSAGTGRLIDAVTSAPGWTGEIVAVENSAGLAKSLREKYGDRVAVHSGDFLAFDPPAERFDRVIMNPPFGEQADIKHVLHALKFLRPGGRLVAIMSASITFRNNHPATEFCRFVDSRGGSIEELPAGSFKASGTSVNAVLVTINE